MRLAILGSRLMGKLGTNFARAGHEVISTTPALGPSSTALFDVFGSTPESARPGLVNCCGYQTSNGGCRVDSRRRPRSGGLPRTNKQAVPEMRTRKLRRAGGKQRLSVTFSVPASARRLDLRT
jgi:hypothetical protein